MPLAVRCTDIGSSDRRDLPSKKAPCSIASDLWNTSPSTRLEDWNVTALPRMLRSTPITEAEPFALALALARPAGPGLALRTCGAAGSLGGGVPGLLLSMGEPSLSGFLVNIYAPLRT